MAYTSDAFGILVTTVSLTRNVKLRAHLSFSGFRINLRTLQRMFLSADGVVLS